MYSSWSPTITNLTFSGQQLWHWTQLLWAKESWRASGKRGSFLCFHHHCQPGKQKWTLKKCQSGWYTKLQTFFWIFNQGYEETGKAALWKEETQVFHWPLSLLFIWPCLVACRIFALFDQGLNSRPQQWKRTVLTTGPPENSHLFLFLKWLA